MTITTEGLGYRAGIPGVEAFFWNKTTAGKFCQSQAHEQITSTLQQYVNTMERASWVGPYYQSIRKDQAFENINRLIAEAKNMQLMQLVNSVVSAEQDLRALIPSARHPYNSYAVQLIEELIWQCISYRKQLKAAV